MFTNNGFTLISTSVATTRVRCSGRSILRVRSTQHSLYTFILDRYAVHAIQRMYGGKCSLIVPRRNRFRFRLCLTWIRRIATINGMHHVCAAQWNNNNLSWVTGDVPVSFALREKTIAHGVSRIMQKPLNGEACTNLARY